MGPACKGTIRAGTDGGPEVDAAWQKLMDRAGQGFRQAATTEDSDLHLLVDGERINALRRDGSLYRFMLPETFAQVRIVSRAGLPQESV